MPTTVQPPLEREQVNVVKFQPHEGLHDEIVYVRFIKQGTQMSLKD